MGTSCQPSKMRMRANLHQNHMNMHQSKGYSDTRQNQHPGPERWTNLYEVDEHAS